MQQNTNKKQTYLSAEQLLRYLLGTDDELDTLITCRGTEVQLTTYDSDLYQAIGSLKPFDEQDKLQRAAKLLEVVDIVPYRISSGHEKKILTSERIDELRTSALKKR